MFYSAVSSTTFVSKSILWLHEIILILQVRLDGGFTRINLQTKILFTTWQVLDNTLNNTKRWPNLTISCVKLNYGTVSSYIIKIKYGNFLSDMQRHGHGHVDLEVLNSLSKHFIEIKCTFIINKTEIKLNLKHMFILLFCIFTMLRIITEYSNLY